MLRKTPRFTNRARAYRIVMCAFAVGAVATGCSGEKDGKESLTPPDAAAVGAGSSDSGGTVGGPSPSEAGTQVAPGMQAGGGQSDSGSTIGGGTGGAAADGGSAPGSSSGMGTDAGSASDGGGMIVKATCGPNDKPEKGLQGDVNQGTVNCGLTLLSQVPGGGSVQGSGRCAYVRSGSSIKAYSLADPLKPMMTDTEPTVGGTESMRAHTVDGRAILVSGSGVYDISKCEDMVKKGEIAWPSTFYQLGLTVAAISGHEISISHDAKRVYSGLGFVIADIANLDKPDTWTVKNWSCEMNAQSRFPNGVPGACEGTSQDDLGVGRQYSHSSDDNLEGTVWYGANQEGSTTQMEPPTARMVDISTPGSIKILDSVQQFPGHSMNWWRTPDGREFIIGANEGFSSADTCVKYPRPTSLGNAEDAYIVEVTGKKFGKPFPLTLDINKPENCEAKKASNAYAAITEHSVYNKNGAAFVMLEFGGAGLRVFDLRDGEHPKEVAYYNDGKGHVHSGVFHYDDARGIMLASGSQGMQVLMLQPQMIAALGLPMPTDPAYPYK